jgi:hypothetical protein
MGIPNGSWSPDRPGLGLAFPRAAMTALRRISLRAPAIFTGLVAATLSASAHAQENGGGAAAEIPVPRAEFRLLGGLGLDGELAVSALQHRLRAEAGLRGWSGLIIGEAALLARVVGSPANALWVRGGFMTQSIDYSCNMTDHATAWDGGIAYRKRWAGGSLFAAETGVEFVSRDHGFFCNDSVVSGSSGGLRVSLAGQLAITHGFGLYARMGVRTGDHLTEIHFLPELLAGIAFDI